MMVLRIFRCRNVSKLSKILSICVIKYSKSSAAVDANISSKVIYPNKHVNHNRNLSATQMKLYRDQINGIQQYLNHHQIPAGSQLDLSVIFGLHSEFQNDKQLQQITKWLHKMPNISTANGIISKDYHIEQIDFVSDIYPMITWKNHLHFKTHKRNVKNSTYRIKELTNYYQLHSVFKHHSIESKMIMARGLNAELNKAYNHLIDGKIDSLTMNDYHHLLGNLGVNILSCLNKILCKDSNNLLDLHHQLLDNQICSSHDLQQRYNENLDIVKYETLCKFLIESYPNYFLNRSEYDNVIENHQRMSHLDKMPFLFEMKTLVKIGKLLDYINAYSNRLIHIKYDDRSSHAFDIHNMKRNAKKKKNYRVFSERQLENGDCSFSVDYCTPDIVLSHPIWINEKPIYWFDAKCTKGANCLFDEKRHYQMYRFTKNYGSGAILALGSADLSIVGINDVVILDCSYYL